MGTVHTRRGRVTMGGRRRGTIASVPKPGGGGHTKGEGSRVRAAGKVAADVRALRQALASTPERPLPQEQFARLLGVSWATVARWETGGEPGSQMAQKLLRLRRAVEMLGDMVTPEYRVPFFEQRHPLLLKLRPIDLLETSEGAEAVYRVLEAAETGAFG